MIPTCALSTNPIIAAEDVEPAFIHDDAKEHVEPAFIHGDAKEHVQHFIQGAAAGRASDLTRLALCFAEGFGVRKSRRIALLLLSTALETQEENATIILAALHESGCHRLSGRDAPDVKGALVLFSQVANSPSAPRALARVSAEAHDRLARSTKQKRPGGLSYSRHRKKGVPENAEVFAKELSSALRKSSCTPLLFFNKTAAQNKKGIGRMQLAEGLSR